jgi:hypothetical protein
VGDPGGDEGDQFRVVEGAVGTSRPFRFVEDHDVADVHDRGRLLKVEQRGVEGAEPVGHLHIVADRAPYDGDAAHTRGHDSE